MSDQQQPPVYKIALGIEYDGSKYYAGNGRMKSAVCRRSWKRRSPRWRTNPLPSSAPGVLTLVYTVPQVVHFETTAQRKDAAWTLGVNANLPGDIAVRWVKAVPDDFMPDLAPRLAVIATSSTIIGCARRY